MISNKLVVLMFTAKIRKKYHIATVACCYLYPNEQSQANNYSAYQEVYEAEAHYVFGV